MISETSPHVRIPIARPKQAPIAIVGMKIPAGIYVDRPNGSTEILIGKLSRRTIMPKVQAVKTIFVPAVSMSKKTLYHSALGLRNAKRKMVSTKF